MTDLLDQAIAAGVPILDDDPFGHDVLEDPLPFQHRLREAGPVVYLSRYGIYGMGRYSEVLEALRNWQGFQSGAGVGLSNFRSEEPWRPPSLLLEADPPRHDAPRRVLAGLLTPRTLRRLRERWRDGRGRTGRPTAERRPRVRRGARTGQGVPAAGVPRHRRAVR